MVFSPVDRRVGRLALRRTRATQGLVTSALQRDRHISREKPTLTKVCDCAADILTAELAVHEAALQFPHRARATGTDVALLTASIGETITRGRRNCRPQIPTTLHAHRYCRPP